jgi:hypothetical protein
MSEAKGMFAQALTMLATATAQVNALNELCDRQEREIKRLNNDLDVLMRAVADAAVQKPVNASGGGQ